MIDRQGNVTIEIPTLFSLGLFHRYMINYALSLAIYLSITRSIPEKILFLSEEVEMKRVTLFAEEEEGSIVGSGGSMGELIQTAGARVWLY